MASPPATAISAAWSETSTATIPSVDDADPRPLQRVSSEQSLPPPPPSELAAPVRMPSTSMGKVTSRRRQRNPRRFVVTELPMDTDGFLSDATSPRRAVINSSNTANGITPTTVENGSNGSGSSNESASVAVAPRASASTDAVPATAMAPSPPASSRVLRPAKTEVRGRFTIIDLSPETGHASEDPPATAEPVEFTRGTRIAGTSGTFRRRAPPRRLSKTNGTASELELPALAASHQPQQQQQLSPHRVDLSGLDRHLVFLQQESIDMKSLLESMISINARWISALAAADTPPSTNQISSGKNPKAVHPATSPTLHMHSSSVATTPRASQPQTQQQQAVEPTLEAKYDRLEAKYSELEAKYEALRKESTQLQRNNIMLDTRLRQEMSLNEELRAHVDQLTQYTESLILGAEPPPSASHGDGDPPPPPRSKQKMATPLKLKKNKRTVSDVSMDSSAWTSNQSALEDDDDEEEEEEEEEEEPARANGSSSSDDARTKITRYRSRRRLRHASLDDSSSSVYSYRDSWVSLFDPSPQSTPVGAWRSHSYDVGEASGADDDTVLFAKPPAAESDNQLEDEEEEDEEEDRAVRRRKHSAMMIMEDLEVPPAQQ